MIPIFLYRLFRLFFLCILYLCILQIYNLVHIGKFYRLKLLLSEATELTLKSEITIYLENYLQQFNSTGLYTRDVNSSLCHNVWHRLTFYRLWQIRLMCYLDQQVINISSMIRNLTFRTDNTAAFCIKRKLNKLNLLLFPAK